MDNDWGSPYDLGNHQMISHTSLGYLGYFQQGFFPRCTSSFLLEAQLAIFWHQCSMTGHETMMLKVETMFSKNETISENMQICSVAEQERERETYIWIFGVATFRLVWYLDILNCTILYLNMVRKATLPISCLYLWKLRTVILMFNIH